MDTVVIRPLTETDVDSVYQLGIREPAFSFDQSTIGFWSKEQLTAWFSSEKDVCLGAFSETGTKLIGFAMVAVHPPTKKAIWENLWVISEARGLGIGELLTRKLQRKLKQNGISHACFLVNHDNPQALHHFRQAHFPECGVFSWFSLQC